MRKKSKITFCGFIACLLLLFSVQPVQSKVFKWHDSSPEYQDLLLLGFGEVTLHYLDVSGNVSAFEASNPYYKADFCSNYRLSLFANGNAVKKFSINGAVVVDSRIDDEYRTYDPSIFRLRMSVESTEPLWDGWRFTGKGVYDPNRQWKLENLDTRLLTQPQEPALLELLMRLESDKYGVIEGGSLRPSFKGSKFSLHKRSLFGIYADLHSENKKIGAEAVGGKLEGKSFREGASTGIRADGTTGPFDLSNAPITRGSEEVKVETRDRFDESTVLSSRTLVRDIDYTVDYLRGRVVLHQPIASETAASDPVFIVITYDYLRDNNDEILGGRANLSPIDGIKVSGSYLKRYLDSRASGTGEDEPENLASANASFTIKNHTSGYFEIAGADNPNMDNNYSAIRAGAATKAIKNASFNLDYLRIEDKFRSFTNSDLNPNKNQQRFRLSGNYKFTSSQTAEASYSNIRGLEKNGQYNSYDGLLNQNIYMFGYRNKLAEKFGFGLKYERRDKNDRSDASHEDNYQNRAIVDVDGHFDDVAILGDFTYNADYELILFRNNLQLGEHDANTNQLAITLISKPTNQSTIRFSQRISLKKDRQLDTYNERQDASFASIQVKPHESINFLSTGEYKRYTSPGNDVSFWQDKPSKVIWAGTFATEYLPLKKIKAFGKIGRHDTQQWFADSTSRIVKDFIQGQIAYFHTHHLSTSIETELQRTANYFAVKSIYKTWDLGFRVNWNRDRLNEATIGLIRRWQKSNHPPTTDLTSSSYIFLLSGSVSLTRGIFGRGSLKEILLNNPLDDEKTFTRLEIGYDSRDWYRVSIGYERIESDTDMYPDRNYTGQGIFVRFSGKM